MIDFIRKIKELGLTINWATVLIGWRGPAKFISQLSAEHINSYALSVIEESRETIYEVSELSVSSDSETINRYLEILSFKENKDVGIELRKWRLVLLIRELEVIPQNPLYALISLTEFWEKFDYPPDRPHEIQGYENSISPQDYYTQNNYELVFKRHQLWIAEELQELKRIVS